jgi:hypothetical protein
LLCIFIGDTVGDIAAEIFDEAAKAIRCGNQFTTKNLQAVLECRDRHFLLLPLQKHFAAGKRKNFA